MQKLDEFFKPLSYAITLVMLGVKSFVVIIFVFVVLIAGLENLDIVQQSRATVTIQSSNEPLASLFLGPQEVFLPTPTQEIIIPTMTNTATALPTETMTLTALPTNTLLPTETATLPSTNTPVITATGAPTVVNTPTQRPTLRPSATLMATNTAIPAATPTSSSVANNLFLVSSPLLGIAPSELEEIITQPFIQPPAGEDSGHHGVDFAFWRRGELTTIEGVPILSVFPGKVISAYSKVKPPYGYMVMVETPLANLPKEILDLIEIPEEVESVGTPSNRLTCPTGFADWWSTDSQSLYVLYGHLQNPPPVKMGQTVKIGDIIGAVGNSGSSTNPHLHLEMRIGPSNALFASMGHYDTTTTDQERHNYCMWRISGQFQLFDPMDLYTVDTE